MEFLYKQKRWKKIKNENDIRFFGTYIASAIAKLLAMLHFIVKEVFNTSISDLMKIFKIDTINEQK